MNKSAIKNFAVRARNKLIEDITQKAYELGITKGEIKDIEIFEGGFKIKGLENSKTYKKYEIKQREKLVSNIKEKGFDQTIEEVAYTWFNRFIALRFMEVNEYLPTGVRVLSSLEQGKTEPDIIKEALSIDFDLNPKEYEEYKVIVYRLMDTNDTEDLYRYLIVKQCNQLGSIMPMVFEEISDYTELLLPSNLLAEGSIVRDLVESIEEDDYKDQVEIIGWMYQYYISEKKDEVFADLKRNKKITKENIPAATQLFTPKWIVKYMVENSLGRLWLESHPDEELQGQWKYYLEEAEQDPEVQKKLDELKDPNLNPEDIKVLDPSMGSGHILVYAFDVLYDIYVKAGYSERDIPQLILDKNLYGLDIDDRAGQLAAFALMMKARSKNRRIFRRKINLNICSIQESNGIPKEALAYFCEDSVSGSRGELRSPESSDTRLKDIQYLVDVFHDAKEYGSILDVEKVDFDTIEERLEEIREGENTDLFELQYREILLERLPPLVKQGRIMSEKYDVVCTNPPYMGSSGMNPKVSDYVKKNYPDSKSDLFAVFIEKCIQMTKKDFYTAMITQHAFMFLSSYEKLRSKLLFSDFVNMAHLGARAFEEIGGEVVQTTSFVMCKRDIKDYKATFKRLVDYKSQNEKEAAFLAKNDLHTVRKENFSKIPGSPIVYWVSEKMLKKYENNSILLKDFASPRAGLTTGDNTMFQRLWFEISFKGIGFGFWNTIQTKEAKYKWYPCNSGGEFRKWSTNDEYVVNWYHDGHELKNFRNNNGKLSSRPQNTQYYFKKGITWNKLSSSRFAVKYKETGYIYDDTSRSAFIDNENELFYLTGFLCSRVSYEYLKALNPTMSFTNGDLERIPYIFSKENKIQIDDLVEENIKLSKFDWNSFETSWDFVKHPLLKFRQSNALWGEPKEDEAQEFRHNGSIYLSFKAWESFAEQQFNQLKSNEEELNRIFIDIYGLQEELTPEVEDKDITIRKADRERDIKSFISYAIGCMFGRYSIDQEGLIYAGGEFDDEWKDSSFDIVRDNVLVIADDDYFEDDIVNRFVNFVKATFGEETLEENLDYIAETLGQKASETSRQTLRRYFLKDFYKDHVKTYQKRPIYWLFDSGKKNGFKALIYMHRYDSSTVARVRTDYLHKLQKMYEAEVKRLDILLESDLSAREKAAAMKKKESINKQIQECMTYDQAIAHIANQKIEIDLDDGVKVNYAKFQGVEVPQGEGKRPLKANLLAKI